MGNHAMPRKVELTAMERMSLLGSLPNTSPPKPVLPVDGSRRDMRAMNRFAEDLELDEDEKEAIGQDADPRLVDPKKAAAIVKKVEFKGRAAKQVTAILEDLEDRKKLPRFLVSVTDKLVPEEDDEPEDKDGDADEKEAADAKAEAD